jgi:hypothetical protein
MKVPIIAIEVNQKKREYYLIEVRPVAQPYLFDRLSIIIEIRDLETKTCKQVWHLQITHEGNTIHRHKKYPVK